MKIAKRLLKVFSSVLTLPILIVSPSIFAQTSQWTPVGQTNYGSTIYVLPNSIGYSSNGYMAFQGSYDSTVVRVRVYCNSYRFSAQPSGGNWSNWSDLPPGTAVGQMARYVCKNYNGTGFEPTFY